MSNSQRLPPQNDGGDDYYDYEGTRGRNVYSSFEGANGFVIDGGTFIAGGYEGRQRPQPPQRSQTMPATHFQYKNASNFRISSGTFISGMVPEPASRNMGQVNPAPPQGQYQHGYNPNVSQGASVTPGLNPQNGIFEPGKGPPYPLNSQYSQYPQTGGYGQAHQPGFNPQMQSYPSQYVPAQHVQSSHHQQMPSAYQYNYPQSVATSYSASSSSFSIPTPPESFAPRSRYGEESPPDTSEGLRTKRTNKFANLFKKKDH